MRMERWLSAIHLRLRGIVRRRDVERVKDESRDVRGLSLYDAIGHCRYAARSLGKVPTFTVAVVLTVTLAVAAGSAAASLLNAVLLRPLPYPESGCRRARRRGSIRRRRYARHPEGCASLRITVVD